jgi:hypothetical protein
LIVIVASVAGFAGTSAARVESATQHSASESRVMAAPVAAGERVRAWLEFGIRVSVRGS